ncbi:MAG: hypothetical protein ABI700_29400, partial [Chloroflexota bacterium]
IDREGTPVDGLSVNLRMSEPTRDMRADWHPLVGSGDGQYSSVGDEIIRPGEWWTVVDLSTVDASAGVTHVAFDWQISTDASVITSRPLTILNWLALLGVFAALIYAAWPVLSRFYRALDLSPQAVTVALGATAAAVAITVIGLQLTQQSSDQVALDANPLPKIVNVVLPSETSLTQGRALYESACGAWVGTSDLQELLQRLPRTRDEDLYAAVSAKGWWSLPACTGDYTADQWWDVVNYLRSLEAVSG